MCEGSTNGKDPERVSYRFNRSNTFVIYLEENFGPSKNF